MTDIPEPFQPTPPPISPSTAQRPPRKNAKKEKAPKKSHKVRAKTADATIDYATEAALREQHLKNTLESAKKPRKKRKVKIATAPTGSMEFYAKTKALIAGISEHTGADTETVEKMFRKLMP